MMRGRLPWMLAVLAVLLVVRLAFPPGSTPVAVSDAVVRPAAPVSKRVSVPAMTAPVVTVAAVDSSAGASDPVIAPDDVDVPGNAFAVRPPPAPPYVPPPPPPPKVAKAAPVAPVTPSATQVMAATEPPLPPVPFQVIGTWDDGQGPGVFLSSPYGTVLARQGIVLQSEYRVTAVTPGQISMVHLGSKREVRLAVPIVPNTPQQPVLR